MLDECEQSEKYVECEKCGEACLREELKTHQANKKVCWPRRPGRVSHNLVVEKVPPPTVVQLIIQAHCTLCHEAIEDTEQGWRDHLMGQDGCLMNKRRTGKILTYFPEFSDYPQKCNITRH